MDEDSRASNPPGGAVTDADGYPALLRATEQLEAKLEAQGQRIHELEAVVRPAESAPATPWEVSRHRWQAAAPNKALTWGSVLTGDAFIEKVQAYGGFGPEKTVLELGPGYGRLLRSILDKSVPFAQYIGIDISRSNVEHLTTTFAPDRVQFLHADAEQATLGFRYDLFLSSLTLKHLYPSFEACLRNLARFANDGCMFFFDLLEGEARYFEADGVTFIHCYSRQEVEGILRNIGLHLVAFDVVQHDPDHVRLLVVAGRA